MQRRHFIAMSVAATAAAAVGHRRLVASSANLRQPLWLPPVVQPNDLTLRANTHPISSGPGTTGTAMTLGDGAIGPSIRVRRGERARITLENGLDEDTILHWHGLRVPEAADGHPRLAVAAGAKYDYDFEVMDRAGTYWYHSHAHHRSGEQVYRGMAGLLLVGDEEEDALELPSGQREIAVVIQDRRLDASGEFLFNPVMHERMEGFFGDVPFINGTPTPRHEVSAALYRLRMVNATTSRVIRLALSTGEPMTIIGTDGGLLAAPETVFHVDLGTGERTDLLVDLSKMPVGSSVMLVSQEFPPPYSGGMGMMGRSMTGPKPQGAPLDLLELAVTRKANERPYVLPALPAIGRLDPATAVQTREFRFDSRQMRHFINGKEWEMERVDARVAFGTTEIWRFVNDSNFPHPVHIHEVQFQVLSRRGGRGEVFPWERGWKDTVLLFPGETVDVIAQFNAHRGLFLLHCHNLVHEDLGMMINYVIE
jgi:FtsP/CotA-like multicopper oxidase with cupredoxin domain